mgnify:FL=1
MWLVMMLATVGLWALALTMVSLVGIGWLTGTCVILAGSLVLFVAELESRVGRF